MGFYQYKKIGKGTANINEYLSSEFLLEGKKRAVLMDTGMGFFNLKKFVKSKTSKEIMVVNSHFHPDHSNGNHKWEKVYIGENDLPSFSSDDVYFKLFGDISSAVYENYPKVRLLKPVINKVFRTRKGRTKYIPLRDGEKINLGERTLIVKDFPGHTPGSITLLDPKQKLIYAGDACCMATWLFTNPGCSIHTYADTARAYYRDVKKEGYKKLYGSHIPFPNRISFIKDYANWVDKLTPEKAVAKLDIPGMPDKLCIGLRPSLKHLMFGCFYFEHQCD